ncbi:MAG: alpha/beta fold hydrolase [Chlorobi bacterium]|nr:alpha/beta fold hydrolase [Chlorobiota bacterium]
MKRVIILGIFIVLGMAAAVRADADRYSPIPGVANRGNTATQESERVSFTTADGVVIVGTLYRAEGTKNPAIVCLHQWRSDRSSYDDVAESLRREGFTVLAIDQRGYGESIQTADGQPVRPDRRIQEDVRAAVGFVRAQKGVMKNNIGLLGASYGASNAIIYAADHPEIRAVVLLSPGLNYFNILPTLDAVRKYGKRPLLAVASSEDVRSVEAVREYAKVKTENYESKIYENAGHGTSMFASARDLLPRLVGFFKQNLK